MNPGMTRRLTILSLVLALALPVALLACDPEEPPASSTSDGATAAPLPTLAQTSTETDRDALVALYNATNGPRWSANEGWLSDAPISTWTGVALFEDLGPLLVLSQNQLSGEIPPELGNLSYLTRLYLNENELSGVIPSELGNLSNLTRLYLAENQLSGEIPLELSKLYKLEVLGLSGNELSGEIPPELGKLVSLERLSLNGNQLSGEIPSELGNLPNLRRLHLDENELSGCLPANLQDQLDLDRSNLGGLPFCAADS